MTQSIRIDLFTDIVCPWCLIGTARLDQALATLPDDVEVEILHHPFLLDPSTPEAGQNTKERLSAKYGGDITAMQARVEAAAHDAGVPLDLSVQPMSYPTIKPHTLIRLAAPEQQYPLAKAFAAAYFLEGQDITDNDLLADIAAAHGYDRDAAVKLLNDETEAATTKAMAVSASQQGINGVPFFIFNNQFAISGGQPLDVFQRAFRVALGEEALN
ncbi:DsbA family oxidoreductase [Pelagibacterium luteolum]|uniref:Predicted dithiol-disulfide isomerase, DsbA family n=1 Tax=Pelagibacterium luteolum TaxID=440168 RepID=A0A1G7WUW2_9HYPH|nr:DsbA family oxidoreductase [Pelagibacterium luteolum]SDG75727.1 Predicted dithiol-disulfide isomerase, DsbA family [Pelagibacterium luteolum]